MRRAILLSLFTLLAVSVVNDARAQHRGPVGHFGRGGNFGRGGRSFGHGFNRARAASPYGLGYGSLPYDYGDMNDYAPAPQVDAFVPQPVPFVPPPAPPVAQQPVHPVVTDYKWPAAGATSSLSAPSTISDSQAFAIVLKNGSTLSAVSIFNSDDGLHYVDPDERHLHISMSEVDRAATLKINRARNLNLHLPAAE